MQSAFNGHFWLQNKLVSTCITMYLTKEILHGGWTEEIYTMKSECMVLVYINGRLQ